MTSFTPRIGDGNPRDVGDRLSEIVSIMDFIPVALQADIFDYSSTDNVSAYVQDAIDAVNAAGGGGLQFPAGKFNMGDVQIKSGVSLIGSGRAYGGTAADTYGTLFSAIGSPDWIVDTPTDGADLTGISGINFFGDQECGGLRYRDAGEGNPCVWNNVADCFFTDCGEQAILAHCTASKFTNLLIYNALLNRERNALSGAIEITYTDNQLLNVEATVSLADVVSADLYLCAILLSGPNNFVVNCIGEISERGLHSSQGDNQIANTRCDLNLGHGFSGTGIFTGCKALNNGQAASNTYDGFYIPNDDGNYYGGKWTGCAALSNNANVHRYGINFAGAGGGLAYQRGLVRDFRSVGHGTGAVRQGYWPADAEAGRAVFRDTAFGTTPNVADFRYFVPTNSSAVTITNFTGGLMGQELVILGNANVTVAHDGYAIITSTGANVTMAVGRIYRFVKLPAGTSGEAWVQMD